VNPDLPGDAPGPCGQPRNEASWRGNFRVEASKSKNLPLALQIFAVGHDPTSRRCVEVPDITEVFSFALGRKPALPYDGSRIYSNQAWKASFLAPTEKDGFLGKERRRLKNRSQLNVQI